MALFDRDPTNPAARALLPSYTVIQTSEGIVIGPKDNSANTSTAVALALGVVVVLGLGWAFLGRR